MTVCESVPTSVSQKARPSSVAKTSRDRYSRLTWWQMPMPGGTSPEVAERALGPAQELVALHVAPVLNGDVGVVGRRVARRSMITEWSITSSTGTSGLTWEALPPRSRQRVAHGGEVHHGGHAGEVLHEHALGGEGDLVCGVAGPLAVTFGIGAPVRHGDDVVGRDVRPVLVAQQVLQEDLDGVGQPLNVVAPAERRRRDVEDLVGAVADGQVRPGVEGVGVLCGRGVRAHGPILPWACPTAQTGGGDGRCPSAAGSKPRPGGHPRWAATS